MGHPQWALRNGEWIDGWWWWWSHQVVVWRRQHQTMKCICHQYDFLMWKEVASPCIEIPKFGSGYAGYLKSVVCSYVSMHHSIHSQKPHLFLGPLWRQHLPKLHFLFSWFLTGPICRSSGCPSFSGTPSPWRLLTPSPPVNRKAAQRHTWRHPASMFGMSPQEGFMSGIWRSGFRIFFIPQHGEWNHPMKCFLTPNLESLETFPKIWDNW